MLFKLTKDTMALVRCGLPVRRRERDKFGQTSRPTEKRTGGGTGEGGNRRTERLTDGGRDGGEK